MTSEEDIRLNDALLDIEVLKEQNLKLLHSNDSLQTSNSKLRQQLMMMTVEPAIIRQEKTWDEAYAQGSSDGCHNAGTKTLNPFTVARVAAEGKKKH